MRHRNTTAGLCAIGFVLLAATAAARGTARSSFEARTTGAAALSLEGWATYGTVRAEGAGPETFVLSLGSESANGSVIVTVRTGAPSALGVYAISESSWDGWQALVLTGSATRPTGAYRARSGTLTVTRMERGTIEGTFELEATGFAAASPDMEDRVLEVHGTFTAMRAR